jgi:hypothetical protein
MCNLFMKYFVFVAIAFASLVSGTLRTPVHASGHLPGGQRRYHLLRKNKIIKLFFIP